MPSDVFRKDRIEEIVADLEPFIQQLQTLGWKEMRPWPEFFATFKPPQFTAKNLEQRVTTNLLFYRSNYVAVCAGVLILQVLFAPMILISTAISFAMYTYLTQIHKGSFQIGDFILDHAGKRYLWVSLSVLILFVSGTIYKILWAVIYSVILCGLHMVFRPRNVQSKANRAYEEMKLSGSNIFDFIPTGLYEDSKSPSARTTPSSSDLEDPTAFDCETKDNYGSMRKRTGVSSYSSKGD